MARATQTEAYWRDSFFISEEDETALQEMFLQEGHPLPTEAVATRLMQHRLGGSSRRRAGDNRYHPANRYEVGERLIFGALDDVVGEIVTIREGHNERYGPFDVLRVHFAEEPPEREFASGLAAVDGHFLGGSDSPLLTPEELIERYRPHVGTVIEAVLGDGDSFVRVGHQWLPSMMLVTFHEGHANIAEAMIDIVGDAMGPAELLTEMPLGEAASDALKLFSLNHALGQDERFFNVGSDEEPRWQLRRLL